MNDMSEFLKNFILDTICEDGWNILLAIENGCILKSKMVGDLLIPIFFSKSTLAVMKENRSVLLIVLYFDIPSNETIPLRDKLFFVYATYRSLEGKARCL